MPRSVAAKSGYGNPVFLSLFLRCIPPQWLQPGLPGHYRVEEGGCCIMGEKYLTTCFHWIKTSLMLSTANITMQFGAKPLFENISVKFGDGNRYGLSLIHI